MNKQSLFGIDNSHLISLPSGQRLHREMAVAFEELKVSASVSGFDLAIVSGFRDFDRQLKIWNGKYLGLRPIYDDENRELDVSQLSDLEKIQSILRFSALPGASRHHWGTDFDYYDKSAVPADYSVKLVRDEYLNNGPFNPLYNWLSANAKDFGFYFPYDIDRGGISPEPWHLSFQPISEALTREQEAHREALREWLELSDIAGRDSVLLHFDLIMDRYILNINRIT